MIDRFLTRIAGARSFAGKLWVLTRPYWFAGERQRIAVWGVGVAVKECWIARGLLATTVALSVLIVYISKLINSWNARISAKSMLSRWISRGPSCLPCRERKQ